MANIYELDGIRPVIDPSAFVHPEAVVIGDVIISAGCYIAPGAVLRGDFGRITVHKGANVQDNCVMHGFPGTGTVIEENGHVGHGAVIHGAVIERNALIGMNAVINDEAVIGSENIVAAMAFIRAATPGGSSYVNEGNFFEPNWKQEFWGPNYERLLRIKRDYDPTNLFRVHHGVGSDT